MSPYITIWHKPKETIRTALSGKSGFKNVIPYVLVSIEPALSASRDIGLLFDDSLVPRLLAFVFALVFSIGGLSYLLPGLIYLCGKLWKGHGTFEEIRTVVSLALIPTLPVIFVEILYSSLGAEMPETGIYFAIGIIAWLFYMRVLILGVAIAQKFSYGISLLSIILPFIPFLLIIVFLRI